MRVHVLALMAGVLCTAPAARAYGNVPSPQHRLYYTSATALRINPIGIEQQLDLGYAYRLYARPGPLWQDCFASLAFTPRVNPAQARIGATLAVKPLALLLLALEYHAIGYYGTFQHLQSYASPRDDYSDTALAAGKIAGRAYGTIGSELTIMAQAQAKLGPWVLRNTIRGFWSDLRLRDGHELSYHFVLDILVRNRHWSLSNDSDLLYLTRSGLIAGARATIVHAFYGHNDYAPSESSDNPNGPIIRTGPVLGYTFFRRARPSRFNKPTVLLLLNWHVRHRFRTGADVHPAIPYTIAAFSFEGDL